NNTDRKSGHCLLGEDGEVWAIDNGLCFHSEPKLRTVIWEFAAEPVPPALLEDVSRVADAPLPALRRLLSAREVDALRRRAHELVDDGRFPAPDPDEYHYPWPLV
ncbi:MAG: phosphatidylinositol kinase, partial [Acidimicrobiales bacterium]